MEANKTLKTDERFTRPVRTRVTRAVYERLEKLIEKGDCHSIGEVSRKILSGEQIKVFQVDASLNTAMEELALIRKELKAIGVNINQLTKAFHSSTSDDTRAFYALKIANRYETVGAKVDELLVIVSQLAEKWLQRS
ncbi:plasmid mobilization protein [Mucilaginibacter paludis]|uniref:Mobilization protein n=1 Tax=Mucilaginibacter paludis DSM 18603 TaxID=714943 RepID=H1YHU1_9SPHI|nr:plasmid mobilization relaxosome protein MobC [Mucilaginibacter paludis]EHQ27491.1 mobilization protein [Mucilaginibacter paludis DSM 18603]